MLFSMKSIKTNDNNFFVPQFCLKVWFCFDFWQHIEVSITRKNDKQKVIQKNSKNIEIKSQSVGNYRYMRYIFCKTLVIQLLRFWSHIWMSKSLRQVFTTLRMSGAVQSLVSGVCKLFKGKKSWNSSLASDWIVADRERSAQWIASKSWAERKTSRFSSALSPNSEPMNVWAIHSLLSHQVLFSVLFCSLLTNSQWNEINESQTKNYFMFPLIRSQNSLTTLTTNHLD